MLPWHDGHDIDYVEKLGPCLLWRRISITCPMTMVRSDKKSQHTFMFPKIYLISEVSTSHNATSALSVPMCFTDVITFTPWLTVPHFYPGQSQDWPTGRIVTKFTLARCSFHRWFSTSFQISQKNSYCSYSVHGHHIPTNFAAMLLCHVQIL